MSKYIGTEGFRGEARITLIADYTYDKYKIENQVNFVVYVPKVDEHFVASQAVIPRQLLGYYVFVAKGLDVNKARKLAKSVTVE